MNLSYFSILQQKLQCRKSGQGFISEFGKKWKKIKNEQHAMLFYNRKIECIPKGMHGDKNPQRA
jgi:hypothetical protein